MMDGWLLISRRVDSGSAHFALRQALADPWVSVLLAAVIIAVAFTAVAWPRFVLQVNSEQAAYTVANTSALQRHLTATYQGPTLFPDPGQTASAAAPGGTAGPWAAGLETMNEVRAGQPEPLRSMMGAASLALDFPGSTLVQTVTAPIPIGAGAPQVRDLPVTLTPRVDPSLREHTRLDAGQWPQRYFDADNTRTDPVPIALPTQTADELNWHVDEVREALTGDRSYLLCGTFTADDPQDPRWELATGSAGLRPVTGENGWFAPVTGYLATDSEGFIQGPLPLVRAQFSWTLDAADLRGDQVADAISQLNNLSATQVQLIPADHPSLPELQTALTTESIGVYQNLLAQQQTTATALTAIAVGPLGATAVIFILAARLLISRRRDAIALAGARGASSAQLRTWLAGEALILAIPAAVAGHLIAAQLLPAATRGPQWLVTLGIAAFPAAALWAMGSPRLPSRRRDLSTGGGGTLRLVVEFALLALTAVAGWRLLTETDQSVGTTGAGPLAALTPLLLIACACAIGLRLYPVAMRPLISWLRRRRSPSGFIGAVRAVRDAAAGTAPALAIVLAVSATITASVLATSVDRGTAVASWVQTGGDIRISGPVLSTEDLDAVATLPGVQTAAPIPDRLPQRQLVTPAVDPAEPEDTAPGSDEAATRTITLMVLDPLTAQVWRESEVLPELPEGFFTPAGPVPALAGGELTPEEIPEGSTVRGLGEIAAAGHLDRLPGIPTPPSFLVIPQPAWVDAGQAVPQVRAVLIDVASDADLDAVRLDLADLLPTAAQQDLAGTVAQVRQAPLTSGLLTLLVVAAALSVALTVAAVALAALVGAPARTRTLAILRTLGAGVGRIHRITVWEMAPMILAALVLGVSTGIGVAALISAAVDLDAITGTTIGPLLHLDGPVLAWVIGTVLAATVLATLTAALVGTSTSPARQLRVGDTR